MEAESTFGGSKERFFSSVYRAYMFFQYKKIGNGMTAMQDFTISLTDARICPGR
jgi:hypothetical protein